MYESLIPNLQNRMPHILEGEIVSVMPNKSGMKDSTRYMVKVTLENGSVAYLQNVQEMTPFGGISDYLRRRSRATQDDSDSKTAKMFIQSEADATVGERVYVGFVNGNINYPIIVGYKQHPNQTTEFGNAADVQPQAILQYLGIRVEVDAEGQIRFIHKGAPQVNFSPKGGLGGLSVPVASGAAIGGDNNDAIDPAPDTEVTLWEMLKEGIFRLRDANGQMFEMDRSNSKITISNQALKSTESASGGLGSALSGLSSAAGVSGESIVWDDDAESITIAARSLLTYKTDGDSEYSIKGDETHDNIGDVSWTIGGDRSLDLAGSDESSIGGDQTVSIVGKQEIEAVQGVKITATAGLIELEGSGGAKVKIGNGQIGLGGASAELLDLIDQTLKLLANLGMSLSTEIHIGNLGYSTAPPTNAADYLKFQADILQVEAKLASIKGGI